MLQVIEFLSHLLARLGCWRLAVKLPLGLAPLHRYSEHARGRIIYALKLSAGEEWAHTTVDRMLVSERHASVQADRDLAELAFAMGKYDEVVKLCRASIEHFPGADEVGELDRFASFAVELAEQRLLTNLRREIAALGLDAGEPLVVTPVSSRFMPLFAIWQRQLLRYAGARTLVVIALDQQAVAMLRADGFHVLDLSRHFFVHSRGSLARLSKKTLWVLRVFVLRAMLELGHEVLSLDTDAMLVGEIDALFDRLPEADLYSQQDFSIPVDVARRWGMILCCGTMLLRSTEPMRRFLALYTAQCCIELDDQTAINHLLMGLGIKKWIHSEEYLESHSAPLRVICPSVELISRQLDQGRYCRHFLAEQENKSLAQISSLLDELSRD